MREREQYSTLISIQNNTNYANREKQIAREGRRRGEEERKKIIKLTFSECNTVT